MQRLPFWIFLKPLTEAFSEPYQTTKIERFAKTFNDWKWSTIFYKTYILDDMSDKVLKFTLVDQAKAAFQNLKKCFSKKKNELKKSNKSQINQIFTRRIKSYLKKDSISTNFIFCIKLLNVPFSSCLRNNSRSIFFFFSFSSFSFKLKPLVAKTKCLSLQSPTWCQKNFKIQIWYMWT